MQEKLFFMNHIWKIVSILFSFFFSFFFSEKDQVQQPFVCFRPAVGNISRQTVPVSASLRLDSNSVPASQYWLGYEFRRTSPVSLRGHGGAGQDCYVVWCEF